MLLVNNTALMRLCGNYNKVHLSHYIIRRFIFKLHAMLYRYTHIFYTRNSYHAKFTVTLIFVNNSNGNCLFKATTSLSNEMWYRFQNCVLIFCGLVQREVKHHLPRLISVHCGSREGQISDSHILILSPSRPSSPIAPPPCSS